MAAVPLAVLARGLTSGWFFAMLLMMPFAGVGLLVAVRQPRNPIGWLILLIALSFSISVDASAYSVAAFRLGHHGLPLARLAIALASGWVGLVLLPLGIMLFPDGHPAFIRKVSGTGGA